MKTGIELIAEERERQTKKYSATHDTRHAEGELARAAACYAMPPDYLPETWRDHQGMGPLYWPWRVREWHPEPDDRIKELVKAGALIAAEIDRLQRAKAT